MAPRYPSSNTNGSTYVALAALLAVVSLLSPGLGHAQTYNVHHYTDREGLPQRQVRALHQDREGYLWFGTFGGLSRYDGATIRTYTSDAGLSSNVVERIIEDSSGRLHLATQGGLCIMEGEGFRCLTNEDGLPANDVEDLAFGSDGALWVATGSGLSRLSHGSIDSYFVADGLPSDAILSLAPDPAGDLWIGTRAGLARLNDDVIWPVHEDELSDEAIQILLPLPTGMLIGTDAGLYLLGDRGLSPLPVKKGLKSNVSFNDAARDSSGLVWIGTSDGLLRYDGESFRRLTEDNGLLRNLITRIMVDREGSIWLGSEAGVSKLVPGPFKAYSVPEGLPNSFARVLAEDPQRRLWVGTRYGVAVREEDRFREVISGEELPDGSVYSLASPAEGGMLIGTRKGLVHWRVGSLRSFHTEDGLPGEFVPSLLRGRSGEVWVGTEGGMAVWQDGRLTRFPEDHPLAGLFVVSLAFDRDDRLWVGLRSGGVRIWDGTELGVLDSSSGLTDQSVWSMDLDSAGRMWVGTNGEGVFQVDGDQIRHFTTHQGLVNDFVWQVLVDSRDRVWLYTNRGLDRYQDGKLEHFGIGDGLTDLEGAASAAMEDSHGNLWFGTSRGVLAYDPSELDQNLVPPPIKLDGVTLGDDEVAPGTRLHLGSGLLRIRFSALSFRDESAVRYRYRLIQDNRRAEPWSQPFDEHSVSFGGLVPGSYDFEVVGVNEDGISSTEPATFSFTVLPALWQTWWFWLLGGGLVAGVAGTAPILRARRLESERARLERRVSGHTRELEEANRRLRDEIQERQRFQEALQASEARLREIVENSTNVFYSHTANQKLTYVSPQIQDLLGVEPSEALVRWTEFATDNPMNEVGYETTLRAIKSGQRQPPYELELRHADGQSVWVRVTEAPVVQHGKTVAIVGSLTDITEARSAEEERQRLEEHLHQAQKMEAVGRLAGGVAHDFNNLLTSIIGHTDLVASSLDPDHPMHPELGAVLRACDRAASLVEQLLAFGRKQMVKPREVSLNRIVEDGTRMLRTVLGEDVRLTTDLSSSAPSALIDPGQLDQILVNLAVNARDAMPRGGTLTISTEVVALRTPPEGWEDIDFRPGTYARLTVTDTGSGMDAETAERAFEPFFTTKEVGKGTGLGLATVYGIVKQNDGFVWVDTEPGEGSTFTVFLPLVQAEEKGEEHQNLPAASGDGTGSSTGSVLVVEDEPAVRDLVCRILERKGYTVYQASNGTEALAAIEPEERTIDLLVTDMIMPGMSGKAVADAITARSPETRVLFISGYTDQILGERDVLTPGVELLEKPFDPSTLLARIQEIMER